MEPYLRRFIDPLDGLRRQLQELVGLAKTVPPLVERERNAKFEEVSTRPDPYAQQETIDIYEEESGPETGWGSADYARHIYSTSLVLAYELLREFMVQEIVEHLNAWLLPTTHPVAALLREEETRRLRRDMTRVRTRFRDWFEIDLSEVPGWNEVEQLRRLRNAVVHNLGLYTDEYLKGPTPRRPTRHLFGPPESAGPEELAPYAVDKELIPLDEEYTVETLRIVSHFATEIRRRLEALPRGGPLAPHE